MDRHFMQNSTKSYSGIDYHVAAAAYVTTASNSVQPEGREAHKNIYS